MSGGSGAGVGVAAGTGVAVGMLVAVAVETGVAVAGESNGVVAVGGSRVGLGVWVDVGSGMGTMVAVGAAVAVGESVGVGAGVGEGKGVGLGAGVAVGSAHATTSSRQRRTGKVILTIRLLESGLPVPGAQLSRTIPYGMQWPQGVTEPMFCGLSSASSRRPYGPCHQPLSVWRAVRGRWYHGQDSSWIREYRFRLLVYT